DCNALLGLLGEGGRASSNVGFWAAGKEELYGCCDRFGFNTEARSRGGTEDGTAARAGSGYCVRVPGGGWTGVGLESRKSARAGDGGVSRGDGGRGDCGGFGAVSRCDCWGAKRARLLRGRAGENSAVWVSDQLAVELAAAYLCVAVFADA